MYLITAKELCDKSIDLPKKIVYSVSSGVDSDLILHIVGQSVKEIEVKCKGDFNLFLTTNETIAIEE